MDDKMTNATNYLLEIGAKVATNSYIIEIEKQIKDAEVAARLALDVEKEPLFEIGKLDTLVRLQRNAEALKFVLSIAHDACLNIRAELHDIFEERDRLEREKLVRQKQALALEIERARTEKKNRKYRANKKAESKPDKQ